MFMSFTSNCFHCGGSVIWDNDYSFDEMGYDGEGVVHCCHCADCGADIEYRICQHIESIQSIEVIK